MNISGTSDELRFIASELGADIERNVYLGEQAAESNVKNSDLSDIRVIMFATHGLMSGGLKGLEQPALALSSPSVVGGKDDGLLTMEEVPGLKLNAILWFFPLAIQRLRPMQECYD